MGIHYDLPAIVEIAAIPRKRMEVIRRIPGSSEFEDIAFVGFGAAVIRPGRAGFRAGDFLLLSARIVLDADELLFVALVLRLLVNLLELTMN